MFLKKTKRMAFLFLSLFFVIIIELFYLLNNRTNDDEKRAFIQITALPDLAINSDNPSLRHRSLSDVFSLYPDDGTLREYANATFCISNFKE